MDRVMNGFSLHIEPPSYITKFDFMQAHQELMALTEPNFIASIWPKHIKLFK